MCHAHLVLDVVVHSRHSVEFRSSRVKHSQTLHGHRVNGVSDRFIQVRRQVVGVIEVVTVRCHIILHQRTAMDSCNDDGEYNK